MPKRQHSFTFAPREPPSVISQEEKRHNNFKQLDIHMGSYKAKNLPDEIALRKILGAQNLSYVPSEKVRRLSAVVENISTRFENPDSRMSTRKRRKLQQQEQFFNQSEHDAQHKGKRKSDSSGLANTNLSFGSSTPSIDVGMKRTTSQTIHTLTTKLRDLGADYTSIWKDVPFVENAAFTSILEDLSVVDYTSSQHSKRRRSGRFEYDEEQRKPLPGFQLLEGGGKASIIQSSLQVDRGVEGEHPDRASPRSASPPVNASDFESDDPVHEDSTLRAHFSPTKNKQRNEQSFSKKPAPCSRLRNPPKYTVSRDDSMVDPARQRAIFIAVAEEPKSYRRDKSYTHQQKRSDYGPIDSEMGNTEDHFRAISDSAVMLPRRVSAKPQSRGSPGQKLPWLHVRSHRGLIPI
ncbi:hypothetical protein BDV96DRAFT_577277 [Lophiotrema nucula]|uniref:Uncharacterized protein n=1 Tax=Lophiotrema nucula TaxID=690887 RepID=A0A6A5Z4F5_9PLEO|nr:hypothetical protein BDV96DRAFT_577277 [Lophiotrema nucula]